MIIKDDASDWSPHAARPEPRWLDVTLWRAWAVVSIIRLISINHPSCGIDSTAATAAAVFQMLGRGDGLADRCLIQATVSQRSPSPRTRGQPSTRCPSFPAVTAEFTDRPLDRPDLVVVVHGILWQLSQSYCPMASPLLQHSLHMV